MNCFSQRAWAEINIDNLLHNYSVLKEKLNNSSQICCVVKANAYGHCAPIVARELQAVGVRWFAVATFDEAMQLRNSGIDGEILIFGYTPVEYASHLYENGITQCVYSKEYADLLNAAAVECGCKVKVHIKINTGMNRLGVSYENVTEVMAICNFSALICEGIFTHFASADTGEKGMEFTRMQYERFTSVTKTLKMQNIEFKYAHCSNSSASYLYPEFATSISRLGILLYGLTLSKDLRFSSELKPVMALKTLVTQIKTVKKGESVSYGCNFIAEKDVKIATLGIGYADGFSRQNSKNGARVYVNGTLCRVVGTVCMDQTMIDVTEVDVSVGDTVTVFGVQECSANDLARCNNTINYEIVCSVGARIPRVFIKNSKPIAVYRGILNTFEFFE